MRAAVSVLVLLFVFIAAPATSAASRLVPVARASPASPLPALVPSAVEAHASPPQASLPRTSPSLTLPRGGGRELAQSSVPSPQSSQPPGTWQLLNPPAARSQHSAVWDVDNGQMLVFGGQGGARLDDLWAYRPGANAWVQLNPSGTAPRPVAGHSAIWDPVRSQMLVFGGHGGGVSDLWSYRPATNTWTPLSPPGQRPTTRGYHSAVWDPVSDQMFIFGGIGGSFNLFDDIWAYHPSSNTWLQFTPRGQRPQPRFFQAAAWDPTSSRLLVFGGTEPFSGRRLDDIWAYDPDSNTWAELKQEDPRPPERLSHTAVWDPLGNQMLVFGGGCGASCFRDDLWAYQPATNRWSQLPFAGQPPGPRGGHTAVWDSAARRMLIFGGSIPNGALNDFWSYQPGTYAWRHLDLDRPTLPEGSHHAIWDTEGNQMLVLDDSLTRIWTYRPTSNTWAELAPFGTAPPAREEDTAVWDPTRAQLLVFGGYAEDGYRNDLWGYRPASNTWTRLAPNGPAPPARLRHSAVWDAGGERMLLFGGYGGRLFDDLWSYRAADNTWEQLSPGGERPFARQEHSAVWDAVGGQMLVFGGARGNLLDDLWSYRAASNSWQKLTLKGRPPTYFGHSAVWDPIGGQMLVLGGHGSGRTDDLWSYRPSDNRWVQLIGGSVTLPGRGYHSAVWDASANRMLIVSGYRDSRPNDLWSYKPTNAAWSLPTPARATPPARQAHAAVWDDADQQMYVYGGLVAGSEFLDDLWSYRPATQSWYQVTPSGPTPPAVSNGAAVWDPSGRQLLLYGGFGPAGFLRDVWVYRLADNAWTRLTAGAVAPPNREDLSAVWDTQAGRMLVFGGGRDGRPLDDLWSFDPATNTWTELLPDGPAPTVHFRHTAVWDPVEAQMLVFGGYGGTFPGGYLNELWSYRPATNSWERPDAAGALPPARARHGAAWDAQGRRLLVMGGFAGGIDYLNDVWSYALATNTWDNLTPAGIRPTARAAHSLVWVPRSERLLAFGGYGGGLFGELWSLRLSSN